MRRSLLWLLPILLLTGCTRLDAIPCPPQTAATWLTIQPFAAMRIRALEIILVQPSTTAFVYFLGMLTIGVGLYFLRIRHGQGRACGGALRCCSGASAPCWPAPATRRSATRSSAPAGRVRLDQLVGAGLSGPLGRQYRRDGDGPGALPVRQAGCAKPYRSTR